MMDVVKENPARKRSARDWIDLTVYLLKSLRGTGHIRLAGILVRTSALLLIGPPIGYLIITIVLGVGVEVLGQPYGADVWGYLVPVLSLVMLISAMYVYISGEKNTYRKIGIGGIGFTTQTNMTFKFTVERLCRNRGLVANFIGFSNDQKASKLKGQEFNASSLLAALEYLRVLTDEGDLPEYQVSKNESVVNIEVK